MKNKLKLKKGDKVIVLTGKDKGKKGAINRVIPSEMRLVVSGVNIRKKHVKANQAFPHGGVAHFEAPIHYSNVALLDPKIETATRVGYKILEDGKKVRFSKKTGEIIDNA